MRVNDIMAFSYNNYPLIYGNAPLQPFNPEQQRFIGDQGTLFNIVVCSTQSGVDDNKCFLFTNADMYVVAESGLSQFLAESFLIGRFMI